MLWEKKQFGHARLDPCIVFLSETELAVQVKYFCIWLVPIIDHQVYKHTIIGRVFVKVYVLLECLNRILYINEAQICN